MLLGNCRKRFFIGLNRDLAGFSTVLYQISAGISKGVQRDDVTVSAKSLTKSFRPARCGERSGWACERPERGGEGYMKNIFRPPPI